ncbi:class I SAM-dependent methyltransferase [Mycolicibacterium moriokaense]|nr:class I SAM-dependent methyltransferase [Mycolicibacterium moriokaense]
MLRRLFNVVIRPPYKWARDGATELVFDKRLGVRTAGEIQLDELGLAAEGRERYKGVPWLMLRRILPQHTVTADDVFIDIGSGMGRALLVAGRYPFRRVIGVELSSELNSIAQQNIDHLGPRLRCKDVTVITADATEYQIPDDVTVVFMANPFQGIIFQTVIENILKSCDRTPRNLRIVYVNPREEAFLLSTGRIRLLRRIRGYRPGRDWSRSNSAKLYEVRPQ